MTSTLVIIGCGGFGREVHDVLDAINADASAHGGQPRWDTLGYFDDAPSALDLERVEVAGARYLGMVSDAPSQPGAAYVIGIGSGVVRERIAGFLDSAGMQAALLVHPAATLGAAVSLGPGTVICAGARLTTSIDVGRHVHVNINCSIGHDTVLEDFVTINPLVAVSGNCRIGTRATLGTHSAVLPGLTVGADAVVGGAACVVRDVSSATTAVGVPAKALLR